MLCPEADCQHSETSVTAVQQPNSIRLPKALRGLNLTRRLRECDLCGARFSTIEVLEDEFHRLKRPPGKLSLPVAKLGGIS